MKSLNEILKELYDHRISLLEAENNLKAYNIECIEDKVKLDIFRHHRTGIPEVIFAETKETEMLLQTVQKMLEKNGFVIISRLKSHQIEKISQIYENQSQYNFNLNISARIAFITQKSYINPQREGKVGIITAGTSDIPVAEEAKCVLQAMGIQTISTFDVGIAGIHRIFPPLEHLMKENVDVIIVIAGMEGTLPGIVTSLVDIPVIGVPTSTGYGMGANGIGALTTMLQSCSPGLSVVNIDNGFGAAAMTALILGRIYKKSNK